MASITQRSGRYQVRVRLAGQPTRTKTFRTKTEARTWAREQEARSDPEIKQAITLAGALQRYSAEITPTKRGAERELRRVRELVRRPIGTRCLTTLRGCDIAQYRDLRLMEVGPSTVQKELALISHVFSIARKEWSMLLGNPVSDVRKPSGGEKRAYRLPPADEERLLVAAGNRSVLMRTFFIVLIETAARRGELIAVRWSDVDLQARLLQLDRTKNGCRRTVPLSNRAMQILSELPCFPSGKVFPFSADYASHTFKELAIEIGVPHLRLHDLRHEAISRLLEKGLSIAEVQSISGHKTLQMLARYAHVVVPPERLD